MSGIKAPRIQKGFPSKLQFFSNCKFGNQARYPADQPRLVCILHHWCASLGADTVGPTRERSTLRTLTAAKAGLAPDAGSASLRMERGLFLTAHCVGRYSARHTQPLNKHWLIQASVALGEPCRSSAAPAPGCFSMSRNTGWRSSNSATVPTSCTLPPFISTILLK